MTNALFLLIYSPLLAIALILLCHTLARDKREYMVRYFLAYCVGLVGWILCEMLYHTLKSPFAVRYLFDLKLAFVAVLSVSIFLSISGFYRLNLLFPPWLSKVIWVVPLITALLAVTSPLHKLLLTSYEVLSFEPRLLAVNELGPWYYIHTIYSQLLAVGTMVVLIRYYHTLPRAFLRGSALIFTGMASYIVCAPIGSLGFERNTLDYNMIGITACGFFFFFASLVNGRTDYLQVERREVFEYLDEAVFILNQDGVVIDINQAGGKLEEFHENENFDATLDRLVGEWKVARKGKDGRGNEDLYVQTGAFSVVYEMHRQKSESTGGGFVMMTDVTNNRLFMERLREIAGLDLLTGLPNRYRYRQILRRLDSPDALPLSVIMGDVNGLKEINDSFGHAEGDRLLKAVAEILVRCCPPEGCVARIGGDEFVLLLPCHSYEEGCIVIHAIKGEAALAAPVGGQPPSIALGCATKRSAEENINLLLGEADQKMYHNKFGV